MPGPRRPSPAHLSVGRHRKVHRVTRREARRDRLATRNRETRRNEEIRRERQARRRRVAGRSEDARYRRLRLALLIGGAVAVLAVLCCGGMVLGQRV